MAVAAAEQQITQSRVNHELERRNDEATWLAETVYGSMRSEFSFQYNGDELIAEDGRELGPIFDGAILEASEMVKTSPNLLFELRRRLVERQEYDEMLTMAAGQGPNTKIVISDYPEELMTYNNDVGGYNAARKQTMVRVITRDEPGKITVKSQSLDMSNRVALEKIYTTFGYSAKEGELLGQRIDLDLPTSWQATVIDTIRDTYDEELSKQLGGKWFAGIAIGEASRMRSTYDFARDQDDILDWLIQNVDVHPEKANQFRYNAAALMEQRYSAKEFAKTSILDHGYVSLDIDILARVAGDRAKERGVTYSGCGMSLASGEIAENQIEDAGYGNKTDSNEKYSFNKKMHCVVCQSPPKKGADKLMCGPCGICRSCDKKLGGKG